MVRKMTCSCGKIIPEGSRCSCKQKSKRDYMRQYQRDEGYNPLKTTRWTKLRKHILKRDKYLCQRCFYKYNQLNSEDLQAHHIKSRKNYPELVFEERNIMTLCGTCNRQLGTSDKLDFELRQNLSSNTEAE